MAECWPECTDCGWSYANVEYEDEYQLQVGESCPRCGEPIISVTEAEQLNALRNAARPVLAAYRSTTAAITEEAITEAWRAFDAAKPELVPPPKMIGGRLLP